MVENERAAMVELSSPGASSPFVVTLFSSFKDEHYLYLLLELCPGGDVYGRVKWSPKEPQGVLSKDAAQFTLACAVMGLRAMHERNIIYRDLKPENMMIDARGYVKQAFRRAARDSHWAGD